MKYFAMILLLALAGCTDPATPSLMEPSPSPSPSASPSPEPVATLSTPTPYVTPEVIEPEEPEPPLEDQIIEVTKKHAYCYLYEGGFSCVPKN